MCKLGIAGGIRVTLKGEEPEGRHSCYWLQSVLRWPTARPMDKQATALLEAGSLWGGSGNEDRSATPAVALPVCGPHWVCALRGTLSGALLSWTQASLDAPSLALSPLVSVVVAPTACALEAPAIGSTRGSARPPNVSWFLDPWPILRSPTKLRTELQLSSSKFCLGHFSGVITTSLSGWQITLLPLSNSL